VGVGVSVAEATSVNGETLRFKCVQRTIRFFSFAKQVQLERRQSRVAMSKNANQSHVDNSAKRSANTRAKKHARKSGDEHERQAKQSNSTCRAEW
jgi:hypothetical protein